MIFRPSRVQHTYFSYIALAPHPSNSYLFKFHRLWLAWKIWEWIKMLHHKITFSLGFASSQGVHARIAVLFLGVRTTDCKAGAHEAIVLHMYTFVSSFYVKTEIVRSLPWFNSSWNPEGKVYGLKSSPNMNNYIHQKDFWLLFHFWWCMPSEAMKSIHRWCFAIITMT